MNRPYLSLPSSPPPLFDGIVAFTWRVDMHNDVTAARVRSVIPGVLYVFAIVQNSIGNHIFNWPPNCLNAVPVNQRPDGTTIQCFIGLPNNILNANIPGTYF
jgi:hypothetical protein